MVGSQNGGHQSTTLQEALHAFLRPLDLFVSDADWTRPWPDDRVGSRAEMTYIDPASNGSRDQGGPTFDKERNQPLTFLRHTLEGLLHGGDMSADRSRLVIWWQCDADVLELIPVQAESEICDALRVAPHLLDRLRRSK